MTDETYRKAFEETFKNKKRLEEWEKEDQKRDKLINAGIGYTITLTILVLMEVAIIDGEAPATVTLEYIRLATFFGILGAMILLTILFVTTIMKDN